MTLESTLFEPVTQFLKSKSEYFSIFNDIAKNSKKLGKTKEQFKTEKWLQTEIAVFLTKGGWIVGVEMEKRAFDLFLKPDNDRENNIYKVGLKNYVNTAQNPSTRSPDFEGVKNDFEKIRDLGNFGLILILLPHNTDHDRRTNYTRKIYSEICGQYHYINEVYSKKVVHSRESERGFWITWWSVGLAHITNTTELRDAYGRD